MAHHDNPFLVRYEIKYIRKMIKTSQKKNFESNRPCDKVL